MTGHDDRDRVAIERIADRARGARLADLGGDATVGIERAERDAGRGVEDIAGEGGEAGKIEGKIERVALAAEVFRQLLDNPVNDVSAGTGAVVSSRASG